MVEKSNKGDWGSKMSTAITANERARTMVIALAGPRDWSDTRGSWLSRVARKLHLSPRRIRAIFYQEKIRLSADEYLLIDQAFRRANDALEEISDLASHSNLQIRRAREGSPPPSSDQG